MPEIDIHTFINERWNSGESPETKPYVWYYPKDYAEYLNIRQWLKKNIAGRYFIAYDSGNEKGRVWFWDVSDALHFKLKYIRE